MSITNDVRSACRLVAAGAQHVAIVPAAFDQVVAGAPPPLDGDVHYLDGEPAAVASYILAVDAINFGSGWFADLPGFRYEHVARALAKRWREDGPLDAAGLRVVTQEEIAGLLGLPAEHTLAQQYAEALRELGGWLGRRTALEVVRAAEPSAERLAQMLADGMSMWQDVGFYKRAQIAASDLALAGVATFTDLHRLTVFADNVLPQVLRDAGVLEVEPWLVDLIDGGCLLQDPAAERELRACAVHACEQLKDRLGLSARDLDNVLWTRGQQLPATAPLPHRTRSVYY